MSLNMKAKLVRETLYGVETSFCRQHRATGAKELILWILYFKTVTLMALGILKERKKITGESSRRGY